jgi:hypothetical protein
MEKVGIGRREGSGERNADKSAHYKRLTTSVGRRAVRSEAIYRRLLRHNAACVHSLCAAAIKPDKEADALTADQSAARQQHIADALATFREAIAAGWKDFAHMQQDPDLIPLRELPEFKACCRSSRRPVARLHQSRTCQRGHVQAAIGD